MSLKRQFNAVWDQLRGKKAHMSQFLNSVNLEKIRGISSLTVHFTYPVTVIAGTNGCGKSTVLFACACAYKHDSDYTPALIFPDLKTSKTGLSDPTSKTPSLKYTFREGDNALNMSWRRGTSSKWNKSFSGQKGAKQPERLVYLRTLSNLTNPSEVRSVLHLSRKDLTENKLDITSVDFAHGILPFEYNQLYQLGLANKKELLFVKRKDADASYSEFHMSAGERAILHLSKDLSRMKNALILIDEIEVGLHPQTQQQMMLKLQQLALRQNLQIIVTSHSPVILESVPHEGRIFLERGSDNVTVKPAHRDIFQRALYGQSSNKLSILCEDSIAESIILGILDTLYIKLDLTPDSIVVGRDTGKNQFPQHIETLGKFHLLDDFLFVLDGDASDVKPAIKQTLTKNSSQTEPLFLPGECPETWLYETLEKCSQEYLEALADPDLQQRLKRYRQTYEDFNSKPTEVAKSRFEALANDINQLQEEIARKIAKHELLKERGEIKLFADQLEAAIGNWRSRNQER